MWKTHSSTINFKEMIILNVASSQNCLLFILWRKENSFYTLHAIVNK